MDESKAFKEIKQALLHLNAKEHQLEFELKELRLTRLKILLMLANPELAKVILDLSEGNNEK